jgi:hypothetical protein
MKDPTQRIRQSALVMRLVGWGVIVVGPILVFAYPPGFFWGQIPLQLCILGPPHPPSPYDGVHPYLLMLFSLYVAWAILLIRGAKDPKAAASLFDFGILANVLHALLMVVQAFTTPNEHAHLWADIPLLFVMSAVLWYWHPNRQNFERVEA